MQPAAELAGKFAGKGGQPAPELAGKFARGSLRRRSGQMTKDNKNGCTWHPMGPNIQVAPAATTSPATAREALKFFDFVISTMPLATFRV
jgi:hypothetical protein